MYLGTSILKIDVSLKKTKLTFKLQLYPRIHYCHDLVVCLSWHHNFRKQRFILLFKIAKILIDSDPLANQKFGYLMLNVTVTQLTRIKFKMVSSIKFLFCNEKEKVFSRGEE